MSDERIDIKSIEARMRLWAIGDVSDEDLALELDYIVPELKRCYERIDYLERIAEEYRQERPEEYCANCYAYLEDYEGDGVKECLCSNCEASE
jgi:hypothetical protein